MADNISQFIDNSENNKESFQSNNEDFSDEKISESQHATVGRKSWFLLLEEHRSKQIKRPQEFLQKFLAKSRRHRKQSKELKEKNIELKQKDDKKLDINFISVSKSEKEEVQQQADDHHSYDVYEEFKYETDISPKSKSILKIKVDKVKNDKQIMNNTSSLSDEKVLRFQSSSVIEEEEQELETVSHFRLSEAQKMLSQQTSLIVPTATTNSKSDLISSPTASIIGNSDILFNFWHVKQIDTYGEEYKIKEDKKFIYSLAIKSILLSSTKWINIHGHSIADDINMNPEADAVNVQMVEVGLKPQWEDDYISDDNIEIDTSITYNNHLHAQKVLTNAFGFTEEDRIELIYPFLTFSIVAKVKLYNLQYQLNNIDKHLYYTNDAFDTDELYNYWLRREIETINQRMGYCNEVLTRVKDRVSSVVSSTHNLNNNNNSIKKKNSGFTNFLFHYFGCCGNGPNLIANELLESDYLEQALLDIDSNNNINFHAIYEYLVLILLQYHNPKTDISDINDLNIDFQPLSFLSEWILAQYAEHFGIRSTFCLLSYLLYLCRNQTNTLLYMEATSLTISQLSKLYILHIKEKVIYTKREISCLCLLIQQIYLWSKECITRYYTLFNTKLKHIQQNSLSTCIYLLYQSRELLFLLDIKIDIEKTFKNLLDNLFHIAFQNRLSEMLEWSEVNTIIHNNNNEIEEEEEEDIIPCRITSTQQAINLAKSMQDAVLHDLFDFNQEFENVNIKIYGNKNDGFLLRPKSPMLFYETLRLECQIFLRKEGYRRDDLPLHLRPLDPYIFELYNTLKEYDEFTQNQHCDLPILELSSWFKPFVERWVCRQENLFTEQYVTRTLSSENWNNIHEDIFYAESVVTLTSLILTLLEAYEKMPYTVIHTEQIGRLFCRVLNAYAFKVYDECIITLNEFTALYDIKNSSSEKISSSPFPFTTPINKKNKKNKRSATPVIISVDELQWGIIPHGREHLKIGIPDKLCVLLSSIRELRIRVSETWLRLIGLSDVSLFTNYSKLSDRRVQQLQRLQRMTNSIGHKTSIPFDEDLSRDLSILLGCTEEYSHVSNLQDEFAKLIANEIRKFVDNELIYFILGHGNKKEKKEFFDGGDENTLQTILDYLFQILDHLGHRMPSDVLRYISHACWIYYCETLENIILPGKNPSQNVNLLQIGRVLVAIEEGEEMFKIDLNLDEMDVEEEPVAIRVRTICQTLQLPTSELINIFEKRPYWDNVEKSISEVNRINTTPFLSRKQLFSHFIFRSKNGDTEADNFIKDNSNILGRFAQLFRKKKN